VSLRNPLTKILEILEPLLDDILVIYRIVVGMLRFGFSSVNSTLTRTTNALSLQDLSTTRKINMFSTEWTYCLFFFYSIGSHCAA